MNFEPGGRFSATGVTLRQLVETAYRRHAFDPRRVTGGPPWVETDRFDVTARAPGEHVFDEDGFPRQGALMLQRLLAERFRLNFIDREATKPRALHPFRVRLAGTRPRRSGRPRPPPPGQI
jgi:uncharacterized protein (TIGR03435 family)